jgi:hypothetical protein
MKCVLSHTECIFSSYFNEEAKVLYCALRDRCTRVQPLLFLTFCCVVSYNERFLTFCSSLSLSLSLSLSHTHTHTYLLFLTFCCVVSYDVCSCVHAPLCAYTHASTLLQCQKRPTVSKETYYSVKRDLRAPPCAYTHASAHASTDPPHPPSPPPLSQASCSSSQLHKLEEQAIIARTTR